MKVAICGYPPFAQKFQQSLPDIDFKFFISDLVSTGRSAIENVDFTTDLPLITFFEFRRLVEAGELDGLIVAEISCNEFAKSVVQLCKLYQIPKVGLLCSIHKLWYNPFDQIYWLDPDKIYLPKLETNLIDACNLNCKGCTHFAKLFNKDDVCPLENFQRDVRQLARCADILVLLLLGGEPLLVKNLDEYLKIARAYLPKSGLVVISNGLLVPSLPKKILDALRENKVVLSVTLYPPTEKLLPKITQTLQANGVFFNVGDPVKNFSAMISMQGNHDPSKSRKVCAGDDTCRALRNGKIYKCPLDALKFKFAQTFGIENFPAATGVDIYSQNFSSLLQMLDGDVEMCRWCAERVRLIPWDFADKPKLEDWLADPDELNAF